MIRDFRTEDAAAVAALLPERDVVTPAGVLHRLASFPPRAKPRYQVAERDGHVCGLAIGRFEWASDETDIGHVRAYGEPLEELFDAAERHVLERGARRLKTYADSDERGAFLEARGYEAERRTVISALEPQARDVEAHWGVELATLGDLEARAAELFDLALAAADLPGDGPETNISFEEWLAEAVGAPQLSREGSFYVLEEARPVAFTWLHVDLERGLALNEMTGTRPEARGRGLATLAKLASVRWAAANGIRRIYTGNDDGNGPMLAINARLGYRPVATLVDYRR